MTINAATPMRSRTKKELWMFFGLTLAVMYLLCFAVVLFGTPMKAFSDQHLNGIDPQILLYPAAYSPTLVALALTAFYGGKAGLRRLVKSIFRWRVGISGWLLSFLLFPALWLTVAIIRHLTVGAPIHWEGWWRNFPLVVFSTYLLTDTGGLGEETGWRGYAMPRLLEGFTPLTAGLIVGFFFGVWHLPGWFLSGIGGHYAHLDFALFVGFTMMLSVVMAFLYVRTSGSVLLAGIIPHMITNIGGEDGIKHYDQSWEYLAYLAIFAVILIALRSKDMISAPPFDPKLSPQYYTDEEERAALAAATHA